MTNSHHIDDRSDASCPPVLAGTALLYSLLGPSALLGIAINVCVTPLNKAFASWTFRVDRDRSLARDTRTSALDEMLSGIRGVKFEASEDFWEARIGKLRRKEVRLQVSVLFLGLAFGCRGLISTTFDSG